MKRIAIFHNFLDNIGGAEILSLTLARELKADVYSTNIDREKIAKMGFSDVSVQSIGKIPLNAPFRQQFSLWLFRRLNLKKQYDYYIISGDWAMAGAVNNHPNLWYVHSPIREIWDLYKYTRENMVTPWKRPLFDLWVYFNRFLNRRYIRKVDRITCNSRNTQNRVKKYLGRNASVINPPIETKNYYNRPSGGYWLAVNRLIGHKRVNIQLDAFAKLPDERLIIVGSYEQSEHFKQYAEEIIKNKTSNIEIRSWVGQAELLDLYANCLGFITTSQDEDFGMTVVEAMSAGKPVIASNEGGYKESIINGQTGRLIDEINGDKLIEAIKEIGPKAESYKEACIAQSLKFDTQVFIEKIKQEMREPIKFSILGERCSGTNFLEQAMLENFNLEIAWEHGWKHFFGFDNFENSDDTLFIGIVRDPVDWLDSFYNQPYYLPENNKKDTSSFLFNEHYSEEKGEEIMMDRNYITSERYKNIFELRSLKNDYLINVMPTKVKNYILIRYEDLRDDYVNTLNRIQLGFNLTRKFSSYKKIEYYKSDKEKKFFRKRLALSGDDVVSIYKNINQEQERRLGYLGGWRYFYLYFKKIFKKDKKSIINSVEKIKEIDMDTLSISSNQNNFSDRIKGLYINRPKLHEDEKGELVSYEACEEVLGFIDKYITSESRTLETGAGMSTLAFAIKGSKHICISPAKNEIDRIKDYCQMNEIDISSVKFIIDGSQQALPNLKTEPLDLFFIDGCHGFPMTFLDWFYGADLLRVGGILIVDDIQLWTGRTLKDFLEEDPDWKKILEINGRAVIFQKLNNCATIKEWNKQPYVESRSN